jgi:hypothetical protein
MASNGHRYRYGRMLRVNGLLVASVMRPSMRSVRYSLRPLRLSGRCQRWWRLCRCGSTLMSRPTGPKMASYECISRSVSLPLYVLPRTFPPASVSSGGSDDAGVLNLHKTFTTSTQRTSKITHNQSIENEYLTHRSCPVASASSAAIHSAFFKSISAQYVPYLRWNTSSKLLI